MALLSSDSTIFIGIDSLEFFFKYCNVNLITRKKSNLLTLVRPEYTLKNHDRRRILRHFAKLQALELPVHPSILETISDRQDYRESFDECAQELARARKTRLHNSWLTYFDFLVASRKKLKNYAGNLEMVMDFKDNRRWSEFPIYGDAMRRNLTKGVSRDASYSTSRPYCSRIVYPFLTRPTW